MSEPAPALHVLDESGAGVGRRLADARRRSGQSLEQAAAATRIRRRHLEALERDDLGALPGPVYARGYLRAYAEHLGLDGEMLLAALPAAAGPLTASASDRRRLSLGRVAPARLPARLVVTGPTLAAAALLFAALLFSGYAWREVQSARVEAGVGPVPARAAPAPPIASLPPLPTPQTSPAAPAQLFVAVRATEPVWVTVTVDGRSAYAGLLGPGQEKTFVGGKVKIDSGKPSLQVAVGGGEYHQLGVLSKEYSAET